MIAMDETAFQDQRTQSTVMHMAFLSEYDTACVMCILTMERWKAIFYKKRTERVSGIYLIKSE